MRLHVTVHCDNRYVFVMTKSLLRAKPQTRSWVAHHLSSVRSIEKEYVRFLCALQWWRPHIRAL